MGKVGVWESGFGHRERQKAKIASPERASRVSPTPPVPSVVSMLICWVSLQAREDRLYSISVENWSVAPVANAPGSWPFWVLPEEGY